MKSILLIWIILFFVTLIITIIFAKAEFKKQIASEKEDKSWRLMGGLFGFYEGALLISLLISTGVAFLIKSVFIT